MRVCSIWQTLAVLKPWLACIHAALLCMSCLYDIPVLWNFQLLWVHWLIEKGVCNLMLHGRLQGLHSRTSGQLTATSGSATPLPGHCSWCIVAACLLAGLA